MTRRTVVAGHREYTVSDLEPRARGDLLQAVVVLRLVDDATGAALEGAAGLSSATEGVRQRIAGGGFAGLVGVPTRVLPELAGTAYAWTVTIEAEGFETRHEPVGFSPQPGFPASFAAADLGDLRLRRLPVQVQVSTYDLDAANRTRPLGLVPARISGWWTDLGLLGSAASVTPLAGVSPGVAAARPAGADLDLPALVAPPEPPRTLEQGVAPGGTRLSVSSAGALVVGDLVVLDGGDPERVEHVEVIAVDGPADVVSPTTFVARTPLRGEHAAGGAVERLVAPGPPLSLATTTAPCLEGDRTLQVTTLSGLAAGQVVRISGGGAPAEYRTLAHYEIVTDADGVGRLPPLSGIAAVIVSATRGTDRASARLTLARPSAAVDLTLT